MNKQQLLEFVNALPDHALIELADFTQSTIVEGGWNSSDAGIGIYERDVDHDIGLRVVFRTKESASFLRTYTDPDGSFRNLRRIA